MARGKTSKPGTRRGKSKAESVTGAKEGAVEVRKVETASELDLPPLDKREYHRKQILGYLEAKTSANSRFRNALKAAQKDGIDTEALLTAHSLKREDNPKKAARRFKQLAMFLNDEGFPVHITISDVRIATSLEDVELRGFTDGEAGRTPDNDYPEGSDMAKRYLLGWTKGQGKKLGLSEEEVTKQLAALEDGDGAELIIPDVPPKSVATSLVGNA